MIMMAPVILIVLRIVAEIVKAADKDKQRQAVLSGNTRRRRVWQFKLFKTKLSYVDNLFNGHFVDVKAFYAARFNRVACVSFIGEIDITQAFSFVMQHCADDIVDTYQHSYFNHDEQKTYFNNTVIVLAQKRMVEIAGNYCQVLHTPDGYDWSRWLMKEMASFRVMTADMPQTTAYTKVLGFAGAAELN
jgi:hypothetical protein